MNADKPIVSDAERRKFLEEFMLVSTETGYFEIKLIKTLQSCLENRIGYLRFNARELLYKKLRLLKRMSSSELEELHVFLRDDFLDKYLPKKGKKSHMTFKKYRPVVNISTK